MRHFFGVTEGSRRMRACAPAMRPLAAAAVMLIMCLAAYPVNAAASQSAGKNAAPVFKDPGALEALAEQGDAEAQYLLGRRNMALIVFDAQNCRAGLEWLARAAKQKHFYARCLLAVAGNNEAAKLALQEELNVLNAREKSEALLYLGLFALSDNNEQEAFAHFAQLARQGHSDGWFWSGFMYAYGRGVAKDERMAVECYQKAAMQGNAEAQFWLGFMYANGRGIAQDERRAAEWYQKAAEQGDVAAQYNLGTLYENGRSLARDDRKAVEWYQKAAVQGSAPAQNNLGGMYARGHGVAKDERKAVEWYQKAAALGNAAAQNNLGTMYARGRGVAQDERKAVEWYQKAAELGDADAQFELGGRCLTGRGVARDERKAGEWFLEAAEQGHEDAQKALDGFATRPQKPRARFRAH